MNLERAKHYTKRFEGLRLFPYKCPAGKLTIGYGHNIEDNGITEEIAVKLLDNDLMAAEREVRAKFSSFNKLNEARQFVLVDLCFNIGINRFLTFKKMLAALAKGEYHTAARELQDSKWYRQVGNRGKILCEIMKSGEY
jgi:lysozyme